MHAACQIRDDGLMCAACQIRDDGLMCAASIGGEGSFCVQECFELILACCVLSYLLVQLSVQECMLPCQVRENGSSCLCRSALSLPSFACHTMFFFARLLRTVQELRGVSMDCYNLCLSQTAQELVSISILHYKSALLSRRSCVA